MPYLTPVSGPWAGWPSLSSESQQDQSISRDYPSLKLCVNGYLNFILNTTQGNGLYYFHLIDEATEAQGEQINFHTIT